MASTDVSSEPASRMQRAQGVGMRLEALGLNTDSELERSLGRRVVDALPDA